MLAFGGMRHHASAIGPPVRRCVVLERHRVECASAWQSAAFSSPEGCLGQWHICYGWCCVEAGTLCVMVVDAICGKGWRAVWVSVQCQWAVQLSIVVWHNELVARGFEDILCYETWYVVACKLGMVCRQNKVNRCCG